MEEFYIKRIRRKNKNRTLEDLIKEFCYCIGVSDRCLKLMILINKKMREKDKISLEEIAKELNTPKTTVSYHIKKFERIGFIHLKKIFILLIHSNNNSISFCSSNAVPSGFIHVSPNYIQILS
jgi:transcriptional antiterminator